MTKEQIISLVKNTLLKVDEQSRYREPLLIRHISVVYEQMFAEMYVRNKRGIHKYVRQYTEILSGETNLANGHTLAKTPITLPRKGGGLFYFRGDTKTFVISDMQHLDAVNDSSFDTADFKGQYVLALSGDEVYGNTTLAALETVTYRIIPKFDEFAATDEVLIPMGQEEMLVDRVIDTIQHMPPTDLINDNTV